MANKQMVPIPEDLKQRRIDVSNLRFYSLMFREHKWETDVLHWSVFVQTLDEIASRIENQEANLAHLESANKVSALKQEVEKWNVDRNHWRTKAERMFAELTSLHEEKDYWEAKSAEQKMELTTLRAKLEAMKTECNIALEVLTRIGTAETIHQATSAIIASRSSQPNPPEQEQP